MELNIAIGNDQSFRSAALAFSTNKSETGFIRARKMRR